MMNLDHETLKTLHACSEKEAYENLNTSEKGLTQKEASQRQAQLGRNIIDEAKKEPLILVFIKNFTGLMAILLWVAGAIAIYSHSPELGIAIWMVNIINGIFSFVQEHRASKATEALKKMLPSYVRLVRDGKEVKELAENLVPGDLVMIEEGDRISADGRLIFARALKVNQSALTGESNPIDKIAQADLDPEKSDLEYDNMVFAGTTVSSGSGKMLVSAIGMDTAFGQIAHLTQNMEEEKSPLQKELDLLTKQITVIAVSIGLFFLLASMFFVGQPFAQAFIFALGMIVAFIPEGLLPTVTLSLAMAVQRMAKENALVKKLSSVETLGATSVICSDKTGTLTQNEMTVNHLWTIDQKIDITGLGYARKGQLLKEGKVFDLNQSQSLEKLITYAQLCSNAKVLEPTAENPHYSVLGDPTEACLSVLAEKVGMSLEANHQNYPRLDEYPFDSVRKRMTTLHQSGQKILSITKGAPKEILEKATSYLDENGVHPMTSDYFKQALQANDTFAQEGLRVLALAYKNLDDNSKHSSDQDSLEQDLTFVGLISMSDPPREGVMEAIENCHKASIRIIMVTGDYGITALSIAKKIGIVKGQDAKVVSGLELGKMTDKELKEVLKGEVVFARVAPEQKFRVVKALQEMGEVVAVTGDGVNDAPALKKADIGVAMGITGTDVAKESADMILTDDNFASIVHAVEEGRAVYRNIQKFLSYIITSNGPEAVPSAFFLFSKGWVPLPLTVMQILTIDLGTDMLPALGLGIEPPLKGVMERPPRKMADRLLDRSLILKAFFWYGMLESLLAMIGFFVTYWTSQGHLNHLAASGSLYKEATTMTLGAIIFAQMGMVMIARSDGHSIRHLPIFASKLITSDILLEIALFIALTDTPFLQKIFNTAPISLIDWLYLLLCPFLMVGMEEIRLAIKKGRKP